MYKVVVANRDEYTIWYEPSLYGPVIHCDVYHTWSKGVKDKLMADWKALLDMQGGMILARHYPNQGDKHTKFLKLMGFRYHGPHKDHEIWIIGD